ncbi:hypothetical protein CEXT_626681 [Caerostris extrusa]|uniref:Uncharacterized protein n=1 Tax=Caerostris extrusa TaxID=172846 RepID=A0AAV4TEP9_CAEEX|nr:hypothetical protein CEXT_626681 [Caerostris extrusa]
MRQKSFNESSIVFMWVDIREESHSLRHCEDTCTLKSPVTTPEPVSQKRAHENWKKDRARFPEKSLLANNSIA